MEKYTIKARANIFANIMILLAGVFFSTYTLAFQYANLSTIPLDDKAPFFQFGKTGTALSGNVTFEKPFTEVPKVFLMPTIKLYSSYYNVEDGPATVTLRSITKTGFSWVVEQPIYDKWSNASCSTSTCSAGPKPMEVHWLAATEGTHTLSDGRKIIVGSVPFRRSKALGMADINDTSYNTNKEPLSWVKVGTNVIPASHSVVLNSRQAKVNNCFLTSIALPIDRYSGVGSRTGTYFILDTSNATVAGRDRSTILNCLPPLPGGMTSAGTENLAAEEIAYLATTPGVGEFEDIDKGIVRYQFGSANTDATSATINSRVGQLYINYQSNAYCKQKTSFATSFKNIPTFVAGKVSVNNNNTQNSGAGVYITRADYAGGFLRRCNLTKTDVSMVTDESYTSPWAARMPFPDRYAFVALEKSPPPMVKIDHFEFDHTGQGLTCNPETITIRACVDAACSSLYTDTITVNLLPDTASTSWVGGNPVTFTGGTAQLNLRGNTPGNVTIGVTGSDPVANSDTALCRKGSSALSKDNCTIEFSESGFILGVPDKLANKPIDVMISAVKKADTTQKCVPAFQNKTKTLNFWSSYQNPSKPISPSSPVTINGSSIGQTNSTTTPINLAFDNLGSATIKLNYPDAGKLQLDALYTGTGDEQGLKMTGSDQFVSVPVGLCVKPADKSAYCPSADKACKAYRRAGEKFNLTVQAMAWQQDGDSDFCDNNPTPSFADNNITLGSKVVAPSGGSDGALSITTYGHKPGAANLNTISDQTINEVGVFQFSAKAQNKYLGAVGLNIPIAYSANIGRFVPDSFLIGDIFVMPACGSFSYMDQPFPMSMSISAVNVAGGVTENYFPPFSFATANLVGENDNNGIDLQSRLSALPIEAESWSQGKAVVELTYRANVSRVAPDSSTNLYQDGPFEKLDIGVQVIDNDPNPNKLYSYVTSPDMDATSTGECTTSCNAKKITTGGVVRHGRVVMDHTYGPETEILRMPTRAEYWNGSNWQLNDLDICTSVKRELDSQVDDVNLGYEFDPNLLGGQSITRSGNRLFQAGQNELLWQAVTTRDLLYRGQVIAPLDVPTWLEWYWNWKDTEPTVLSDPRASAFFGTYRGHDRVIFWREVN